MYNESAFYGLDYVLDTAATYGVRVLFTMADYWLGVDSFKSVRTFILAASAARLRMPHQCVQRRALNAHAVPVLAVAPA